MRNHVSQRRGGGAGPAPGGGWAAFSETGRALLDSPPGRKYVVPGVVLRLAAAIDATDESIRGAVPLAARIYLEPDVWRAGHIPTPDGPVPDLSGGEH